jgi:hypothetical protein
MKYFFTLILLNFSIFSFGQEIEITKIEYSTTGYASAPDFDLIIYSDRTIIFNARADNYKEKFNGETVPFGIGSNGINIRESEVKGIFKTKANRKTFKEISDLIQSLKTEFIEKKYSSNELHSSVGNLRVSFANGNTQSIYDYGLSGTEKLLKVYNYFSELRFNQKWK